MDPSSSGGHSDRPRNNRSRGGRNRNQNRNRNRDRGRDREGGQGGRSSNRRPRKPEDDIMRERFPRPEPKPTLWQKILAFFGVGGDAAKPTASPSSSPSPKADRGGASAGEDRKRRGDRPRGDEARDKPAKKPRTKRPVEKVDVTSGRLYVGNLDYGVSDEDLAKLFGTVGTVEKAEVVIHRRSGKSKGFAFVEMGSVEEAKQAVDKFHDQDFQGRQLLVCGAKSEGQREDEADGDGDGNQGGGSGSASGDGERPRRERKPRGGEGGGGREERGGRNRRGKKDFGDGEPEAPRKPKAPAETVTGTKLSISGLSDEVTASDLNEGIEDIAKPVGMGEVTGGAVVVEFASVEDAQRALDVLRGKQFMGRELQVTGAADDQEVGAVPASPTPEPTTAPEPKAESEQATEATAEDNAPVEEAESAISEAEAASAPEEAPGEPEAEPKPEPVVAETAALESETPPVETETASDVVEEAPSSEASGELAGEKEDGDEAKPSESQS